jgi:hypothetical protein
MNNLRLSARRLENYTTQQRESTWDQMGCLMVAIGHRFRFIGIRLVENFHWFFLLSLLSLQVDQSQKGSATRARAATSPS